MFKMPNDKKVREGTTYIPVTADIQFPLAIQFLWNPAMHDDIGLDPMNEVHKC